MVIRGLAFTRWVASWAGAILFIATKPAHPVAGAEPRRETAQLPTARYEFDVAPRGERTARRGRQLRSPLRIPSVSSSEERRPASVLPRRQLLSGRDFARRKIVAYVSTDNDRTFGHRRELDHFRGNGGYTSVVRLSSRRALMAYYSDSSSADSKPDIKQVWLKLSSQ